MAALVPSELALGVQTLKEMHLLERLVKLWAVQTFGGPERVQPCLTHLRREVEELALAAAQEDWPATAEEAADCLILLMALAGHAQFDLTGAFKAKMLKNLRRRWLPADQHGVIEHDRSADEGDPQ